MSLIILIPYLMGAFILLMVYLTIRTNLQTLALPETGDVAK